MLPLIVKSGYQIYKEDTDKVATWLAAQGQICGYQGDIPGFSNPSAEPAESTKRLKGRARKEAKIEKEAESSTTKPDDDEAGPPTYTLKVKDFIALAQKIAAATKPAVRVPSDIANALSRAIELRQKYSTTLGAAGDDADQAHQHFLRVLEQTREILRPKFSKSLKKQEKESTTGTAASGKDASVSAAEFLTNKFEALDVQEPSESLQSASGSKAKASDREKPAPRYQVEAKDDKAEEDLAATILMQDVSRIRPMIKRLWTEYQNGFDLVAVALTTNTAFKIVKNLEIDFKDRFPDSDSLDWRVMEEFAKAFGETHKDVGRKSSAFTFGPATYDAANSTMAQSVVLLRELIDSTGPENYPPFWNPGPIQQRDTSKSWRSKTAEEKGKDDKALIYSLFGNMYVASRAMHEEGSWPADEMCLSLKTINCGETLPFFTIFANQCFLDVHHTLDTDVEKPFAELQQTAVVFRDFLSPVLDANSVLGRALGLAVELKAAVQCLMTDLNGWIIENNFWKRCVKAFDPNEGGKLHEPNLDLHQLLKNHPILCGMYLYRMKWGFQDVSMGIVNSTQGILTAAHLYNCLREEELLTSIWKDMEVVLMLQQREKLLLTKSYRKRTYLDHVALCAGLSATELAPDSRRAKPKNSDNRRQLKNNTPLLSMFTPIPEDAIHEKLWTVENLYSILRRHEKTDSPVAKSANTRKLAGVNEEASSSSLPAPSQLTTTSNKKGKQPEVTSQKSPASIDGFLEMLAESLASEKLNININHLLLHHTCWDLLSKLFATSHEQLIDDYGEDLIVSGRAEPAVVILILQMYALTPELSKSKSSGQHGPKAHPTVLNAVKAIEQLIQSGQGSVMSEDLERRGLDMDFKF